MFMFEVKTALTGKSPTAIRKFFFGVFSLIEAEDLKTPGF